MRAVLLLFLAAASPALAQSEQAIAEVREAWTACTAFAARTEFWTGWHSDYGNGYGHDFEFRDGSWDSAPSVLEEVFLIDGIAIERRTSCFRPDGTLAFVYTRLSSPNMASGMDGPEITREGRIYLAPDGSVIRVLGQITQDGRRVADTDNDAYMLARGCGAVDLHLTLEAVIAHRDSVLADIEGNRPAYEPNSYDWCAVAQPH